MATTPQASADHVTGSINWQDTVCQTCPGKVHMLKDLNISSDHTSPTSLRAFVTEEDGPNGKIRTLHLHK